MTSSLLLFTSLLALSSAAPTYSSDISITTVEVPQPSEVVFEVKEKEGSIDSSAPPPENFSATENTSPPESLKLKKKPSPPTEPAPTVPPTEESTEQSDVVDFHHKHTHPPVQEQTEAPPTGPVRCHQQDQSTDGPQVSPKN